MRNDSQRIRLPVVFGGLASLAKADEPVATYISVADIEVTIANAPADRVRSLRQNANPQQPQRRAITHTESSATVGSTGPMRLMDVWSRLAVDP